MAPAAGCENGAALTALAGRLPACLRAAGEYARLLVAPPL